MTLMTFLLSTSPLASSTLRFCGAAAFAAAAATSSAWLGLGLGLGLGLDAGAEHRAHGRALLHLAPGSGSG